MKKDTKQHILEMLSENLKTFYPGLENHFMCPTCLALIPLDEDHRISEAHIIPRAAGGNQKTFICRDCNSRFGSKQDKWFGEILRIANDKHASLLSTAIKEGYFEIDGIKVNGRWEMDENGNFTFFWIINLNPPEINELVKEKFADYVPKINLRLPLPILRNHKLIDIGFLTAGYLMWFDALGYSWVLQGQLDLVRKQIMNPDEEIIDARYLFSFREQEIDWSPWFGIMPIDNEFVPAFGIKRQLVVFPPRDRPSFYESLQRGSRTVQLADIRQISVSGKPVHGPPVAVMFEDRVLVAPDLMKNLGDSTVVILFTKDSEKGHILTAIDKDKSEKIKKSGKAKVIEVKLDP